VARAFGDPNRGQEVLFADKPAVKNPTRNPKEN